MSFQTTRFSSIIGAATLAVFAAFAVQAAPASGTTHAKDVAAIKAGTAAFNANYKAHAVDKLIAGVAADAIGYTPFSPVSMGPGDAKSMAADFAADPAQAITLTDDRVEASGDLGYAVGRFERTATNPTTHAVETTTGGYVTVLRKQADGSWKVVAYSVSPGPPTAAPAAKP